MEPIPGFLKGKIVCKCCRHNQTKNEITNPNTTDIQNPNIKLKINEKNTSENKKN